MTQWLRHFLFLPEPSSNAALSVDRLHFFVVLTTFLGASIVTLTTVFFLLRYRARHPAAVTQTVRASKKLELIVAGSLLTLFVVWWVLGFRQYLSMQRPPRGTYDIHVTAKQWMWKFSYPDGKSTVGYVIVPRARKVRLVLTSRDVIHSFFVPSLRLKRDALPHRYTSMWFEPTKVGIFDAFCAEYCGLSHSRMLSRLVVLSEEDFSFFLDGAQVELVERARRELDERGLRLHPYPTGENSSLSQLGAAYSKKYACLTCHATTQEEAEPHVGPSWVGLFGSQRVFSDGSKKIADEEYLHESIIDPMGHIVAGFDPTMPTYRGQMSQGEEQAIISFIRSLRSGADRPVDAREGSARQ